MQKIEMYYLFISFLNLKLIHVGWSPKDEFNSKYLPVLQR